MKPARKKLPIGISSLTKIIQGDYYYVDKTGLALQLIEQGSYYFLSRPRRFGKSLFLDTLKEIFEGNQALFHGLQIHEKWDWTIRHPVIRLNFRHLKTRDELAALLHQQLEEHERQFSLPARYPDAPSRLADIITRLHQQSGQRVVVLVDEYDKPILDQIEDIQLATTMREELKTIYGVLKDLDAHLRFVFLTGVSKFAKVSLFSGLNNLEDITLDPLYSAICGYTEHDLNSVFVAELPGLDQAQTQRWYNGYNWLGESVYNPYDLLLLFKKRVFHAWWFETGTPAFLMKLMAENGFFSPKLASLRTDAELISTFDIDRIAPEALLFQAGYLTIHHHEQSAAGNWRYTLGYPNREVEVSLNSALLNVYAPDSGNTQEQRILLEELLLDNDLARMRELFQSFFAGSPDRGIPYHWYVNNRISDYEGYYASVFYSYFAALGFDVRVEDATHIGRIDMVVKLPLHIYLFEFKVVELLPAGRAMAQLKTKAYADKYRSCGLPITLVGVEFSRETRNVVGFESEAVLP
jgi:hypothetical protein